MKLNKSSLANDSLLQELIGDWKDFLTISPDDNEIKLIQLHERTGRPLGDVMFIEKLESLLKINLKKKRAGRKKKGK